MGCTLSILKVAFLPPIYYLLSASIHFEGATVKYMDALTSVAGGDFNVTYTHVSKYARKAHPGSWYTAVVQGEHESDLICIFVETMKVLNCCHLTFLPILDHDPSWYKT